MFFEKYEINKLQIEQLILMNISTLYLRAILGCVQLSNMQATLLLRSDRKIQNSRKVVNIFFDL